MPVKSHEFNDWDALVSPGDFMFYMASDAIAKDQIGGIVFMCPCGCGCRTSIPFKPPHDRGWGWNGEKDKITTTPSIKRLDGCLWHGFLTNGEWVSC